ncbi:hypothetical protein G9A89_021949 [Geosiphon pyriformis]|nr:hypothetical protein G9A89_021949 [Geosiphon pyriformis]
MTRAKNRKAASDICSKIFNKISIREALSVVEATRQNVLETFPLFSNREKLPLVATESISSSLAGFSPVKVPSKKHTWISPSVAFTPTKSPKVFNNRPVNKLVFLSIDSTSGASDKISVALFGMLSKMDQNQPLVMLPNVVSSGRSLLVLEAKQSPFVGSPVFENWVVLGKLLLVVKDLLDNMKLFCMEFASQQSLKAAFLVELTSSVSLVILKIAKSLMVSKSGSSPAAVMLCNVPLGVFATDIKLALSVFGSVTCIVLKPAGIWQYVVVYFEKLDSAVSALKHWSVLVDKDSTILSHDKFKAKLIGGRTCFILHSLNSGHRFQFVLVIFDSQDNLDSAVVKTGTLRKCHIWCQEMGHLATNCKISPPFTPKSRFVGSASYVKTVAPSGLSEFPPLVAFSAASTANPAVSSRLNSLEKQILDLAALVKSIVEPVGSLIALVSHLLDDNAAKTVQVEKDLISMKSAVNNFFNLLVGIFKDIACLRSEVDFGDMDYNDMLAAKPSFLSEDTIECVIALWRMSSAKTRSNIESTRLFLSEFIFDSRNLNDIIERICGLGLFSPTFDSA